MMNEVVLVGRLTRDPEVVTTENNKKRALITIIGIAGCTGLMLAGFGIRDSVIDIPNLQFGKVFKY